MSDSRDGDFATGRVTTAEVARRLDLFREEWKEDVTDLKGAIASLSFVGREEYLADQRARDVELENLRASVKEVRGWIIAGTSFVVLAVLGAILAGVLPSVPV